jgi:hypothetical protein
MQAFAVFAWLFFVSVVYQVFLAGLGLLGGGDMTNHVGFGYMLPLVAILLFLVALVAHPDKRTFRLTLLLMVLTIIQTTLPPLRDEVPVLAALHPVNALLIFWLALTIAQRATALARTRAVTPDAVTPDAVTPDAVAQDEVQAPQEA